MRAFYLYAHSCVIEIIGHTWEKFHNICDSKLGVLSLAKLNIYVILYNFRDQEKQNYSKLFKQENPKTDRFL